MNEVKNLSDIYGYERLYATLMRDGYGRKSTRELLYGCYLSNISALNNQNGEAVIPVQSEVFYSRMENTLAKPYNTEIQTIKALTLLEWNMDESEAYAEANSRICGVKSDYAEQFYATTGYSYRDSVSSHTVCEDTLDPVHEPTSELNPCALLRKHDTGTKLVYICAPLRGDVEKNIEFARQKAREVFREGNIPVCPHLMFPPIADPKNPAEDKAAMEMCLKLIDRCNEIHVYGNEWTDGMWKEIRHAERMKIPVKTDQTEIPRNKRHVKTKQCR